MNNKTVKRRFDPERKYKESGIVGETHSFPAVLQRVYSINWRHQIEVQVFTCGALIFKYTASPVQG